MAMLWSAKVQIDCIKAIENNNRKICGCVSNDKLYLIDGGSICYVILKPNIYINVEKLLFSETGVKMFKDYESKEKLPLYFKRKEILNNEKIACVFADEHGVEHYVDEKFLKPFVKFGDIKYYTTSYKSNSPIFIEINGIPTVCVMPLNPPERKEND